jgi:hypothetical protein
MALSVDKRTIQDQFETLTIVQKGTEDDFELRASADEKVWGVRLFDDDPAKPTFVLYAGPSAKELACDAADYDLEEEEDDDAEEDDA